MEYEIYDRETANLVSTFCTEREALELIWRAVQEEGAESVASWVMGRTDHRGEVLSGQQLIEHARQVAA